MPADAGGGPTKMTVGVCASVRPSPVAVNVTLSGVVSVTVNTTAPLLADDVPLAGAITAWLPAFAASVTVFPISVLSLASPNRTVIATAVDPSAGTIPRNGTAGLEN